MTLRCHVAAAIMTIVVVLTLGLCAAGCGARPEGGGTTDEQPPAAEGGDRRRGGAAFDVQGHRGARGHAPENTLEGFRRALAIGVTTLEMDLALTSDGVVVVHHDETLNVQITRDADGEYLAPAAAEPLRELTADTLRALDVGRIRRGSDYAARFPDQVPVDGATIPTLEAVFALAEEVSGATIRYNLELKRSPTHPDRTADPDTFARAALAVVDAAGLRDRVTFQSFDFACLDALAALLGDDVSSVTRACLTHTEDDPAVWQGGRDLEDHGGSWPAVVAATGCDIWSPYFGDIDGALVAEAQGLGLRVVPWTVNEEADIAAVYGMGVDGMISDYPDRLRVFLRGEGEALPRAFVEGGAGDDGASSGGGGDRRDLSVQRHVQGQRRVPRSDGAFGGEDQALGLPDVRDDH